MSEPPPARPVDLRELQQERLFADPDDRALIAHHVLAVVALFAGDAQGGDLTQGNDVAHLPGEPEALVAERQIRDLAPAAERQTLHLPGFGARSSVVVSEVLDELKLLDDYQRIVRAKQHRAFGEPVTPGELQAQRQYRRALAEQAAEAAAQWAAWVREDRRLCVCGHDYGAHRRVLSSGPGDQGPCSRFRDVDTLRCASVPANLLPKALQSWATRTERSLTPQQSTHALLFLGNLCRRGTSPKVTLAEAFVAAAAALDL